MSDYRIVVVDEILPKSTKLTVEKLRLIWASRVRCRRLCGYEFPAGDHPITTANERLSVRTYCEVRNYGGTGPGELVLEAIKPFRGRSARYVKYRVRRPLVDDCIVSSVSFANAARVFLDAIRDFQGIE